MRINCAGESGIVYRILIVDDEKIERTGLRLLLGKMDQKFEITEAVNGKEALEWLSCNRADILVTDIRMPFVDGLELVEQAARLYPDMKAMVFSGYGEFEYARRAMRFGVEEYILKPVNPTEFQNAIKKIIRVLEESKQEKSRRQTEGSLFKEYILNAIFNGTPGNPAPVPISITFSLFSKYFKSVPQSTKCLTIISFGSIIAVKFIF